MGFNFNMENKTWIKLYRKIKEKGWYQKSQYVHLWVHILIKADHKEKEFPWNGEMMTTKKGQFITGRKKLNKETGIPATTIERILDFFEKDGQIGQQKNNKFRLITVLNYEEYQKVGQLADIKRTSNGHLTDTYKELKETKEQKESISMVAVAPDLTKKSNTLVEEMKPIIQEFINQGGEETVCRKEANKFHSYWTEPNKSKTKLRWELEKTWDTKRRLQTWFSRIRDDFKNNPPKREVL